MAKSLIEHMRERNAMAQPKPKPKYTTKDSVDYVNMMGRHFADADIVANNIGSKKADRAITRLEKRSDSLSRNAYEKATRKTIKKK